MRNSLTCQITGAKRVTNNSYLGRKSDRLGIDVKTLRRYYISKPALGTLKADIKESGETAVAEGLGTDVETVRAYVVYNGKNKLVAATAVTA
jgi:hypothetical protein